METEVDKGQLQETAEFLMKWNRESFAPVAKKLETLFAAVKEKCKDTAGCVPAELWKERLRGEFLGGIYRLDWESYAYDDKFHCIDISAYNTEKVVFSVYDYIHDSYRELFKGYWSALSDPDMAYEYASQIHFGGGEMPPHKAFYNFSERLSQRVDKLLKKIS